MGRRLASGVPRRYADSRTLEAVLHRGRFQLLDSELGPLRGSLREDAADIAVLWVNWRLAQERARGFRARRATGRGRRPSEAAVMRAEKRAGLEWSTYDPAAARLRELAARNGHPPRPSVLTEYRR